MYLVPVEATGVSDVVTALTTAVTSIAGNIMDGIAAILPVAAPIMGAMLVIGVGIAVVKKFTGRKG